MALRKMAKLKERLRQEKVYAEIEGPSELESELFGHEKGAFTGAVNQKARIFNAVLAGACQKFTIGVRRPEGHRF